MSKSYILVTPAKNEEDSLPSLIQSITSQILRPILWVIVDDGSTDSSGEIIRNALGSYPWIKYLRLPQVSGYNIEEHYAEVCRAGFDFAMDCCARSGAEYDYVALSDADMWYPPDYFHDLIEFLESNPAFGIVSGSIGVRETDGQIQVERFSKLSHQEPRGSGRVWRREAFERTGGYHLVKSPDSVSNILARLDGWEVRQLTETICVQTRETGLASGVRRGFFSRGRRYYYLGFRFPSLIFESVSLLISGSRNSFIKTISFVFGYLQAMIRQEEKVPISSVREFAGDYRRLFRSFCRIFE